MREDFYGSLQHTRSNPFHLSFYKKNAVCDICHINTNYLDIHKISGKVVEKYFCDSDLDNLSGTYSNLYPNNTFPHIHRKHLLFNDLKVLGEQFTSEKSRPQRSSAIMAYWGEPALNTNNICPLKVGLVEYFFIHTLCSNNGTENEHLFATVKWHQDHFRPLYLYPPIRLVYTLFESESKYSFIPISRFLCRSDLSPKLSFSFDYGQDYAIVVSPYFLAHAVIC